MAKKGLLYFNHFFSKPHVDPFDEVTWVRRDAIILGKDGKSVFEQKNVEFPESWSQTAVNIVASKYFYYDNKDRREDSLKQLILRVADTLYRWGVEDGYFDEENGKVFRKELIYLLLNQYAAFNSPVWFNMGIEEKPQCSACFINSVEDRMDSILELVKTEGMLFKYGSGTGTNFSTLRSSFEKLSGGGIASGPVSFMKGYDAFAGVIKSGGKTRRAAKMVILNIDHPDIEKFITCKMEEEKKAYILIDNGYSPEEAYSSVFFQNANNSVRVSDEFMKAVVEDREWFTRAVTNGEIIKKYRAKDLMLKIAESAHFCGDPGIQFDTTINKWNTCKASGKINASNPCSEYMFLDNSACNLASLNLVKFLDEDGTFNVESFKNAIRIIFISQEIIVDRAGYPTKKIEKNSHLFRPIGLGYANLGALLMNLAIPYDSDEGRGIASSITSIMTGMAYRTSAEIAGVKGPFKEYRKNKRSFLEVMNLHLDYTEKIENSPEYLKKEALSIWQDVVKEGKKSGFRNAQATVLAPTGTIGFMMDCDTTGIEPDIALLKFKQLVGGGVLKIVNNSVEKALKRLGYPEEKINKILEYVEENGMVEGSPDIKEEHLPVFDCALKPHKGNRFIHHMGHVKMMAAVQPFLSGAISKTVNLPENITVEEIKDIYLEAWKLGLKSIAVYRDGSKRMQPLTTSASKKKKVGLFPVRRRLPRERNAITHKFQINNYEGYIIVGMYEDGKPGEIFLEVAKEGSTISGLMDGFATAVSMALQYGVPLEVLVNKFTNTQFEPSGFTKDPNIKYAKSLLDYIFKWLALKFLPVEKQKSVGIQKPQPPLKNVSIELSESESEGGEHLIDYQSDAPICPECGSIMVRNGACYKCENCGSTSGCS